MYESISLYGKERVKWVVQRRLAIHELAIGTRKEREE
jgi:hypothetical protein